MSDPNGKRLSRQERADLRHQLRTPLNHIIGYSEMLLEDVADETSSDLKERLQFTLSAARRILEQVQRTLLPSEPSTDVDEVASLRQQMTEPLHEIVRAIGVLAQHSDERSVADVLRISTATSELLAFVQGHHQRKSLNIEAALRGPAVAVSQGEGRLLVVDDDEANRDILSRHLVRQGYSVVTAEEGTQALDLLSKQPFDLVLLDFMMPGMNGLEVLQAIRADSAMHHIPVVMVSALDEMEGIAQCIEQGAEDYLFKPFDPVLLRARLHSTLERKRLGDLDRKRTADLEEAQHRLEAANEELSRFAYAASHDLQEPLRMVSSYVELLARRYKGQLGPDAHDFITFAQQGAQRMSQLIDNLLAYSRFGSKENDYEEVSAEELLNDVLQDLQKTIHETGATVEFGSLAVVQADRVQFERLLQNLISNGIKYRGSQPPVIQVRATEAGDYWEFEVRDNGIGIDAEAAQRIFRPFERLHGREIPGTGLGLAICQRVVERHGGRIWVESVRGQGSSFRFTIPRVAAPQSAPGSDESTSRRAHSQAGL